MASSIPVKGYVYIAYGSNHTREARLSAKRLRVVDSEAHITLITDADRPELDFDSVLVKPDLLMNYSLKENTRGRGSEKRQNGKVNALGTPVYKKNLFLDADTWCVESPRPLFDRLDSFDICIASDPGEIEIPTEPGLTPYNTGVLAYVANQKTKDLFQHYRDCYYLLSGELTKYHGSRFKPEQPYFMLALQRSACKVLCLSTVWNARYRFCTSFTGGVKIIHGPRPACGWEELARRMNDWDRFKKDGSPRPLHYSNRVWDERT